MRILIFDPIISGHHLEYLHHLYMMAVNRPQDDFVFAVHPDFEKTRSLLEWPSADNISFDALYSIREQNGHSTSELLKSSWRLCKQLKTYVRKHKADKVFTNNIISFVPFAPLILGRGVTISGIIYHIYLYKQNELSRVQRAFNKFKYQIMAHSKVFGSVLILNDQESAETLNREYKCNKFVGLPDPYVPVKTEGLFDFREKYCIPSSAKLFAHFGGLAKRKGTLDILESVRSLDEKSRNNYWFVFAGAVNDDIKDSFYKMYHNLVKDCHILVKDEFCSYEYLASLCEACDAILAPYHETGMSSGMLGYASQFGKPIIAPSNGLIGKLLRKFGLGFGLESIDDYCLCESYKTVSTNSFIITKDYVKANNVKSFQEVISKCL